MAPQSAFWSSDTQSSIYLKQGTACSYRRIMAGAVQVYNTIYGPQSLNISLNISVGYTLSPPVALTVNMSLLPPLTFALYSHKSINNTSAKTQTLLLFCCCFELSIFDLSLKDYFCKVLLELFWKCLCLCSACFDLTFM